MLGACMDQTKLAQLATAVLSSDSERGINLFLGCIRLIAICSRDSIADRRDEERLLVAAVHLSAVLHVGEGSEDAQCLHVEACHCQNACR